MANRRLAINCLCADNTANYDDYRLYGEQLIMTENKDKPTIIDGIDVSGCKHFKIGTCLADYLLTDMNFSEAKCELCKNCYYKQLKIEGII